MTQLPHLLKRIRLNLARSKEFPQGSGNHGYEFVAPLDANGRIEPTLWKKYREHCGVRRFWEGEDDEIGRLVHKRFGDHAFRNGEYVSIRDEDGVLHTFQVVSVEPAT
jgi:hypothetical protein